MTIPASLRFGGGQAAACVRVRDHGEIRAALDALGLMTPQPVAVLVGGAGGLTAADRDRLRAAFRDGLVGALERSAAVGLDGGTHSGVMRLLGEMRTESYASFPLVGVAAVGTVRLPGESGHRRDAADLDPNHTGFVLVPGMEWGAEASWIARIATELAGPAPSVTVLVNGGEIAYSDVHWSVRAGRPVLALAGSGRVADELCTAMRGECADPRAVELATSGLVRAVPADDPGALAALVNAVLCGDAVQ